ncbi:MAG TPA: CDP-alcohol phosphatidyltransferase family protein, partial [Gemmatimonas sp.]|nr:CDP-alcohol phosphatidyltransferase family protein [Gemmatimonas sp.]
VPPNMLSLLAFAFGIGCAVAAFQGHDAAAVVLWLVNRTIDGLDGTHARVHQQQSDFGGYLDIVLDFAVYAAIPCVLVVASPGLQLAPAGVFLLAAFFVNAASLMYLAAILERRQIGAASRGELTTVTMPPGIVAGAETVVFFTLFLGIAGWREVLFWIMGGLVCLNVLQRLFWAWRTLRALPG